MHVLCGMPYTDPVCVYFCYSLAEGVSSRKRWFQPAFIYSCVRITLAGRNTAKMDKLTVAQYLLLLTLKTNLVIRFQWIAVKYQNVHFGLCRNISGREKYDKRCRRCCQ